LRTLFRRTHEHRLAEKAQCSVLRIRTSPEFATDVVRVDDESTEALAVESFLQRAAAVPHLQVTSKQALFASAAHYLGRAAMTVPSDIEKVLWRLEKRQNTYLGNGVALCSPTMHGLEVPTLGLFTTDRPVDYAERQRGQVDVLVVVLGSHRHRQIQLWLLERATRMLLDHDLALFLRASRNAEAMRNACRAAAEREAERHTG
jgi:mannitol/fructose-specific phosphotransferase system IIA component (Ntr-type)